MRASNPVAASNVVLTERVDHWVSDGRTTDHGVMSASEVAGDEISAWREYFHVTVTTVSPSKRTRAMSS